MATNTAPVFRKTVNMATGGKITAANTGTDGTGSNIVTFMTAVFMTYVDLVRIHPLGNNVATLLRIWVGNSADLTIASNNSLLYELEIPAISGWSGSGLLALPKYVWRPEALCIPPSHVLRASLSVAVSAGIMLIPGAGAFE